MISLAFFLLLVSISLKSYESKLSDKWSYLKTSDMRCILGLSASWNNSQLSSVRGLSGFIEASSKWIAKANCSVKWLKTQDVGVASPNGSYNGFIGEIQQNLVDSAWCLLRTDSLPYEPGKLTAPLLSADVGLVSFVKGDDQEIQRDVISFLELELPVWMYSLVSLFFFIPLFLVLDVRPRRNRFQGHIFLKSYLNNCFTILILLLNQTQFSPRRLFAFVLTLAASACVLFAVTGILRNTVGANLIVKRSPHKIDSLADLFQSQVMPLVFVDLYEHQAIRQAVPGTNLYRLLQLVQEKDREQKSFINGFEEEDRKYLLNKMQNDGAVLLLSTAFSSHLNYIACFAKGSQELSGLTNLHISSDTFAAGTMTGLMSHEIHPYVEKIISYLFITYLETDQLTAATQIIIPQIPDQANYDGVKYDVRTLKCIDKVKDDEGNSFVSFSLANMAGVFKLWVLLLTLSFFVLIVENVVSFSTRRMKITRRLIHNRHPQLPQAWLKEK